MTRLEAQRVLVGSFLRLGGCLQAVASRRLPPGGCLQAGSECDRATPDFPCGAERLPELQSFLQSCEAFCKAAKLSAKLQSFLQSCKAFYDGEFDPSSGRTLAAGLTHASRTRTPGLRPGQVQWRTGAYRVDNLPGSAGQPRETAANTARCPGPAWGPDESLGFPGAFGWVCVGLASLVR